jgi:hypothetical protein
MNRKLVLGIAFCLATNYAWAAEGGMGFRSSPAVFNENSWSSLISVAPELTGEEELVLESPAQVVFLYNAWHLPGVLLYGNIRLSDLEEGVFHRRLDFSSEWPPYSPPGYVAAVRKKDGKWLLVAEMGKFYLIEDGRRVGTVRK